MDAGSQEALSARAEFYLCLARAFLVPREETLFHALRDALADDLGDLAAELGYDIEEALGRYRQQIQRVADPIGLLQTYSAIFLVPPTVAHINAGWYLDGAVDGGSVKAMEAVYRRCGVERDEGFRDLSDHVSVQLEFVALLYATQARRGSGRGPDEPPAVDPGQFLQRFARRWLDGFCADLAAAAAARQLEANPYLPLAQILSQAAARDAVALEVDPKTARKQNAIERARAKYAGREITTEDLARIRRKLEAHGLATAHLAVPPELRDGAMGLIKRGTPGLG